MSDIDIRREGVAGRITLTRPQALNALTYEMCLAIEDALDLWRDDPAVRLVIIDAAGDRAFCSGGDIAELYASGKRGDFAYGRKFWRDEYRLNAKLFEFPKPVVSLMQGFTMGGGVGVGCHGSHRIVCESSQIAMPEVGIGLVPDVGGSLILARAPGRLGEYLGTTAARMGPADAILAGFADHYVPQEKWPDLIETLTATGELSNINAASASPLQGEIGTLLPEITTYFGGDTLDDILASLHADDSAFTVRTLKQMSRNSPLSMACAIEMIHRLRGNDDIRAALELEYRFTYRAMEKGDFLEGIRAAIIDKDRSPNWQFADTPVPANAVSDMLLPLGSNTLTFDEKGKAQ